MGSVGFLMLFKVNKKITKCQNLQSIKSKIYTQSELLDQSKFGRIMVKKLFLPMDVLI